MSAVDVAKQAETLRAKMEQANPANAPQKTEAERKRIPLSTPQRKLELPAIPGYVAQWFLGEARVMQALRGGWEFVTPEEAQMNDVSLGGDGLKSGSTDMGTRVSIVAGSEVGLDGQVARLTAMKLRQELYDEDEAIRQQQNDRVVEALTASIRSGTVGGPAPGETAEDAAHRYVKTTKIPRMFIKKPAKRA